MLCVLCVVCCVLATAVYLSWVRNSLLMTVLGVSARGSACNKDHRWKKRLEENSVSIGRGDGLLKYGLGRIAQPAVLFCISYFSSKMKRHTLGDFGRVMKI